MVLFVRLNVLLLCTQDKSGSHLILARQHNAARISYTHTHIHSLSTLFSHLNTHVQMAGVYKKKICFQNILRSTVYLSNIDKHGYKIFISLCMLFNQC